MPIICHRKSHRISIQCAQFQPLNSCQRARNTKKIESINLFGSRAIKKTSDRRRRLARIFRISTTKRRTTNSARIDAKSIIHFTRSIVMRSSRAPVHDTRRTHNHQKFIFDCHFARGNEKKESALYPIKQNDAKNNMRSLYAADSHSRADRHKRIANVRTLGLRYKRTYNTESVRHKMIIIRVERTAKNQTI